MITVTIRENVVKNMNRLVRWVNLEVPKITEEQATRGARFARDIAPKDTGALIQAIEAVKEGRGSAYRIVSRTPKHRDGRLRPYNYYLHEGVTVNIKNGREQRYMKVTARMIAENFPKEVMNSLRKRVKK